MEHALPSRALLLLGAVVLLVQGCLIFVPMAVLGAAIDWPASLDLPAREMLPLLAAHLPEVRLGYGVYLAYSILFAATGALVVRLAMRPGALSVLAVGAIALAAASALARAIGIVRWLTGSTALAQLYVDPGTDAAQRLAIEATQTALNAYGGTIGEALGVGVFAGLWALAVSALVLRERQLPGWVAWTGIVAGVSVMLPALEMFGIAAPVSIAVSTTAIQLWFMALGLLFLWRAVRPARTGARTAR